MELESQSKPAASRINGAKSRGPITPEGKARSSQNALKHGLYSNLTILPGESEDEFEEFLDAHMARYQPNDPVELDLVRTMAVARWRLRRIPSVESDLLDRELGRLKKEIGRDFPGIDDPGRLAVLFRKLADNSQVLPMLIRYEASLTRIHDRAFKHLTALQKLRNEPKPQPSTRPPLLPNADRKGGDSSAAPTRPKNDQTNPTTVTNRPQVHVDTAPPVKAGLPGSPGSIP